MQGTRFWTSRIIQNKCSDFFLPLAVRFTIRAPSTVWEKENISFPFFLFALGPLILLSFTLQSYLQLTKIGLQCERVPRERDSVMAGREWTWRHNFDMCSWPPLMNRKIRIYPSCICNLCKCQPLISNLKISPKKVARLVNGWKIEIN